jgi:hypothetical protein
MRSRVEVFLYLIVVHRYLSYARVSESVQYEIYCAFIDDVNYLCDPELMSLNRDSDPIKD